MATTVHHILSRKSVWWFSGRLGAFSSGSVLSHSSYQRSFQRCRSAQKLKWWSWQWTWLRGLASTSTPSGTGSLTSGLTWSFLRCCKLTTVLTRGYKIPVIENLGTTMDQFDCIDFSDNEVRWYLLNNWYQQLPRSYTTYYSRKLDGFPYLQRVKCLLLNNNRIVRIGESLELNLPRLDTLMLTNNSIQVAGVDTINMIMLYM